MASVLYAPGLGYYSAGAAKFGEAGDFVTAPEISSLFGRTLARAIADDVMGMDLLELGAGSGKMAADILVELNALDRLPAHYFIVELSADLRERQHALIEHRLPELASRVVWLERLPETFSGVIVANEVMDALPVHVIRRTPDGLLERGVTIAGNGFGWREKPLTEGMLYEAARRADLPHNYTTEFNLAADALLRSLASMLERGYIYIIDYGFDAAQYHHTQRSEGTLMCHYRHHAHSDPFFLPGLQDITTHVNFTALAAAADANGLRLCGYTTQANFLMDAGIIEMMNETQVDDVSRYLPQANQVQRLLSPAEMGELFKVIAFGKPCERALPGFKRDLGGRLLETTAAD